MRHGLIVLALTSFACGAAPELEAPTQQDAQPLWPWGSRGKVKEKVFGSKLKIRDAIFAEGTPADHDGHALFVLLGDSRDLCRDVTDRTFRRKKSYTLIRAHHFMDTSTSIHTGEYQSLTLSKERADFPRGTPVATVDYRTRGRDAAELAATASRGFVALNEIAADKVSGEVRTTLRRISDPHEESDFVGSFRATPCPALAELGSNPHLEQAFTWRP